LKRKKYNIKILTENDSPSTDKANDVVYFEDMDKIQQDAIIDLLASIVKTKYSRK